MKKNYFGIFLLVVAACNQPIGNEPPKSGDGATTTTIGETTTTIKTSLETLPTKYCADIPDSLKSDGGTIYNLFSKALRKITREPEGGYQSYGYLMIKQTIDWLVNENKGIAKNFVLTDAAIKGLTPSSDYNLSKDIEITEDMYDTVKSLSDSDVLDFEVGDIETIPTFKYVAKSDFNASKIDASVDATGFDFCVLLDYRKEYGLDLPYYLYLLWTEDKTLVKVVYDYRDPISPFKMEVGYDSSKKISNMIYSSEAYPWVYSESLGTYYEDTTGVKEYSIYNIKMQEKNPEKNGIMIKEICKYSSSGVKSEYIVEGYADDLGGYCETVVTTESSDKDSDLGIFGSKTTDKYREQFDSKGIATGWQFYNSDPAFGKVGWQDFDSDFDGNSDFTWSDTEYDDSFEDYETSFEEDLTSTDIDDTADNYSSKDETLIETVLPNNLTWDTTVSETKKTFVITSDGNPPKSNGENVISYQTVYKVDYSETQKNNITFNVKEENASSSSSYKLYEVENNVISLTGTASDSDYGDISTNKIVNLVVKGTVEITKTASGVFESASSGISTVVQGTTTAKFKLPAVDASKWAGNETAKLIVITSDKKPPLPDGSNVLGTKVVPKEVFNSANPAINVSMSEDSVANNVGMYVYPQNEPPAPGKNVTYDITTPDNPDTIEIVDANGDGEYENNESPDDPPDEDAPEKVEDSTIPAPTGVTASILQCSAITLKWSAVTGATGYKIYYADGNFAGSSFTPLFQDTKAEIGVDTSYYVVAYKLVSGVEKIGQKSSTVTGKRPASLPIPTISAGENDSTGINVSLSLAGTDDDNIESFEIWRKTGDTGDFTLIKTLTNDKNSDTDAFKDTTVEGGKKYYYKVKSKDEDDNVVSDFSVADPGEMKPFDAPAGVSASTDKSDKVVVSWNEVIGAKDYEVYRSDKGKNVWAIMGTVISPSTSFEDKTCATAKEYDYVVIARTTNPVNESPKSLIATGKLGASTTTTTTTTVPPASSVTITYEKIGTGNDGKIHWAAIDTSNVESMTVYWTYASSTSWSADGGNAFNANNAVSIGEQTSYTITRSYSDEIRAKLVAVYKNGSKYESNIVSMPKAGT